MGHDRPLLASGLSDRLVLYFTVTSVLVQLPRPLPPDPTRGGEGQRKEGVETKVHVASELAAVLTSCSLPPAPTLPGSLLGPRKEAETQAG